MRKDLCVLLAPDSFKESMTAKEVCEAMKNNYDIFTSFVQINIGGLTWYLLILKM